MPKDNIKILTNNEDELIMPEPTYCIVNSNNILWICHKACNIEFGDCDYSLYVVNVILENQMTRVTATQRMDQKQVNGVV